jgi:hypothetical protein
MCADAQPPCTWKPLTLTNMTSSGFSARPSYANSAYGFSLRHQPLNPKTLKEPYPATCHCAVLGSQRGEMLSLPCPFGGFQQTRRPVACIVRSRGGAHPALQPQLARSAQSTPWYLSMSESSV